MVLFPEPTFWDCISASTTHCPADPDPDSAPCLLPTTTVVKGCIFEDIKHKPLLKTYHHGFSDLTQPNTQVQKKSALCNYKHYAFFTIHIVINTELLL